MSFTHTRSACLDLVLVVLVDLHLVALVAFASFIALVVLVRTTALVVLGRTTRTRGKLSKGSPLNKPHWLHNR